MDLEPSPMEDSEIECSPVAPSTPTQDMVEYDKSKYTSTILQLIEGRKEDMGFYVAGNWKKFPSFTNSSKGSFSCRGTIDSPPQRRTFI